MDAGLSLARVAPAFTNIKATLGDFTGALEALEAVENKMTYDEFHAELLVFLGRHAEAREEYVAFVKKYPKEHARYLGLATTLQTLGERDMTLDAYHQAVALTPNNPQLLQRARQAGRGARSRQASPRDLERSRCDFSPTAEARALATSLRAAP